MLRQANEQQSPSERATTASDLSAGVPKERRASPDQVGQPTALAGLMVTQRQLDRFRHLTAMLAERRQLRQDLVELLAAGASIEPGPLSLAARRHYARRLSQAIIREFLGDEGTDWILSQMEPTPSLILTVREEESDIRDTQSPQSNLGSNG